MHSAGMFTGNKEFDFDDQTKVEIKPGNKLEVQFKGKKFSFTEDGKTKYDNEKGEVVIEYVGLTTDKDATESFAIARFAPCEPGKSGGASDAHYHSYLTEEYYILAGKGNILIDGVDHQVSAGDHIHIPHGKVHQVANHSEYLPLELLVYSIPAWTIMDFHLSTPEVTHQAENKPF